MEEVDAVQIIFKMEDAKPKNPDECPELGAQSVEKQMMKPSDASCTFTDVPCTVLSTDQTPIVNRQPGYAAIKSEYLIQNHVPHLAPKYLSVETKTKLEQETKSVENDSVTKRKFVDNANGDKSETCEEREVTLTPPDCKKIKLKGRNKKRPVTFKSDDSVKMCPAILQEQNCKFGNKCKFAHDISVFMQNKPQDLGEECYNFKTFGKCPYGFACRFSKHHLTDDWKNIVNQEVVDKIAAFPQVHNCLSKDLQHLLWKKKYSLIKANKIVDDYYSKNKQKKGTQLDRKENNSFSTTSPVSADNVSNDVSKHLVENVINTSSIISCDSDDKAVGCIINIRECWQPREKKLIDFSNKLYLAPLTTVGNLPFRRLCKQFGADITCGEMAMSTNLLQGQQSEWALLRRHHTEDMFGVQICGGYPDTMTRCAQLLQEQTQIDFIDINCGCPIDLIYKRGEGSALMGKPSKLEDIIRCMTSVLDVPLTVKMRTGIVDGKSTAHMLIPRLRNAGAALVTIHGRSREQRYTKLADWNYIKMCAEAATPLPVFGNGDILSYEDANLYKEASGVSGVMIARGALIKPWIFTEIKEQRHWDISAVERFDILRKYCNYGLEYWGSDTKGVENTRRFLLEWLSFLHRYIPVGLLEHPPQKINEKPPRYQGRSELETLLSSPNCVDWIKISEMLLGPLPPGFTFLPKHKANAYQ